MRQLPEMAGRVFTDDIPMPEPPKAGFLKGASSLLFGGGPKNVDREELFGENAGKPASGVAKHVTGPNMTPVLAQSAQGTSEVIRKHATHHHIISFKLIFFLDLKSPPSNG